MKSGHLGRYKSVKEIEEKLLAGETSDPKTGRRWKLSAEDAIVEPEPDDLIWLLLADKISAAIPPVEGAALPDPVKAYWILENGLGVSAICHPANQEYVMWMLGPYFQGRSEGLAERFETPKARKGAKKSAGRRPPKRKARRQ